MTYLFKNNQQKHENIRIAAIFVFVMTKYYYALLTIYYKLLPSAINHFSSFILVLQFITRYVKRLVNI